MNPVLYILNILHDLPTTKKCRYFTETICTVEKEDEYEKTNWCNNCYWWHTNISARFNVKTVYDQMKNCSGLKASLLKSLINK